MPGTRGAPNAQRTALVLAGKGNVAPAEVGTPARTANAPAPPGTVAALAALAEPSVVYEFG